MKSQLQSADSRSAPPGGQQGFTIMELMIVVGIIGILAVVAIPAYQAYTIRARLTEAVNFAGVCKSAVSEYYSTLGAWPANAAAVGSGCAGITTPAVVSGVTVTSSGRVVVGIYGTRTGIGAACQLIFTPNANGTTWVGSTTCPPQFVPSNFR